MDMPNPFPSADKAADSGHHVVLHPLVILNISDYITRHALRGQSGPVVGALLGQHNGRETTIEHAFELPTEFAEDSRPAVNPAWFEERLALMKTMLPSLDLVGVYTLLPKLSSQTMFDTHGPPALSTEATLLLAFHPDQALKHEAGSRLPITIYESIYEPESKNEQDEDKEMRDGEAVVKYRELPYTVEMGEAEMISMDFVARGAGNATAVEPRDVKTVMPGYADDAKGKRRAEALNPSAIDSSEYVLSRDEEEAVAALTTKANAVKMLQSRIKLLMAYLERLPPSHLSGDANVMVTGEGEPTVPSHTILRSIQALMNRLSLVVPVDAHSYGNDMLRESNDVGLMGLLDSVMQNMATMRQIGNMHHIVELARANSSKKPEDSRILLGTRHAEV